MDLSWFKEMSIQYKNDLMVIFNLLNFQIYKLFYEDIEFKEMPP